jgi:hypothetical protein
MRVLGYAFGPMGNFLACPFCRELSSPGEHVRCPACDVELVPLEKLPPSREALEEEALRGEAVAPEDRVLPASYFGRGRGALLVLGMLGLLCFFMPWVEMRRPEIVSISGYDLARARAGWLWGGAVGWFILLPLVWTRRTIYKMRGVRIICATFAAMTLLEAGMLIAMPPAGSQHGTVDFSWGWGLYASALIAALGVYFGSRFGGRAEPLEAQGTPAKPQRDSRGETLH